MNTPTHRESSAAAETRVLVADDDQMVRRLVVRVLGEAGFSCVQVGSGTEALEAARAQPFALAILDVEMPGMTGFEVCTRIREDPALAGLPVMLLTGLDDVENRVRGIDLGANEYLTKPFHGLELIARVNAILRERALRNALEEALGKFRRFNTVVENVTMGLDRDGFDYARLERVIVETVLGHGDGQAPSLILAGLPDPGGRRVARCTAYWRLAAKVAAAPCPVEVPDVIRELPHEVSVGLRYGALAPGPAAAVSAAIPAGVAEWLCNAAILGEGSHYLAAFNYGREVTRFDAELLRGLSMYLTLAGRLAGFASESDDALRYTVGALARAAEADDSDTGNHIVRVNTYAGLLAAELKTPARFIEAISFQAQLHDVGKIHVSPAILRKPGALNDEEWKEMRLHPQFGAQIIGDSPRLAIGRSIALSHHERFDGSGYPAALRGDAIPLEGRIVAVADVYDAVRNRRCYKPAQSHETAVDAIVKGDGRTGPAQFDPAVIAAFTRVEPRFDEFFQKMS